MKASDLRALTEPELKARIAALRRALFDQTIQHRTNQLENTATLAASRRNLARALTIERERSRQA